MNHKTYSKAHEIIEKVGSPRRVGEFRFFEALLKMEELLYTGLPHPLVRLDDPGVPIDATIDVVNLQMLVGAELKLEMLPHEVVVYSHASVPGGDSLMWKMHTSTGALRGAVSAAYAIETMLHDATHELARILSEE